MMAWATLRPPPLYADAGQPRYRLAIVPKPLGGQRHRPGSVRGFRHRRRSRTATLLAADGAAVESRTTPPSTAPGGRLSAST
ncbi:MAG: hypothetical protein U0470_01675 [Anaerolineae bacterium]